VAGEVLGDDLVGEAEVAVPQGSPRFVEGGVLAACHIPISFCL